MRQCVSERVECSVSLRQFRAFLYQLEYDHQNDHGTSDTPQSVVQSVIPTAVAATALNSALAVHRNDDDVDDERLSLSHSSSNSSLPSFGSDVELDLPFDNAPPARPQHTGDHLLKSLAGGSDSASGIKSKVPNAATTAAIATSASTALPIVSNIGANYSMTTTAMLAAAKKRRDISSSGGWNANTLNLVAGAASLTWAAWRSGVGSAADLWTHAVHSCLGASVPAHHTATTGTGTGTGTGTATTGTGTGTGAGASAVDDGGGDDKVGALFRFLIDGRSIRARSCTQLSVQPPHEMVCIHSCWF
jgi:hypothetical protein